MAIDLLGQAKRIFGVDIVHALGVALDEPPDRVEQALAMGGPTFLAGLMNAVSDPREAGAVADALRDEPRGLAGLDALKGVAGGLGDLIRGGSLDAIVHHGQALLRTIFGDKFGRVMDLIADDSGARPGSITTILGLLAPALAGPLRDALTAGGLDGLRDLLAGQRDAVIRQAPGGLADAMGLRSLADLAAPTAPATVSVRTTSSGKPAPRVVVPTPEPEASMARWAVPVALGFLILVAGFYLMPREAGRGDLPDGKLEPPPPNRPADVAQSPRPDATAEGRPVVETASKGVSLALPGDVTIEVPEGSYLESMVQTLRDGKVAEYRSFVAGDITFDADGKPAAEASRSIGHIARIAKAYPNSKLKVEGRESLKDAQPVVTREQAQRHADAVREALIQAGVPAERVTTEIVAPNLPAEHPAAIAKDDVPISISIISE